MGEYRYRCEKCQYEFDHTVFGRLLGVKEDNARPPCERPRCPKCNAVSRRKDEIQQVLRPIWIFPPSGQVGGVTKPRDDRMFTTSVKEKKRKGKYPIN